MAQNIHVTMTFTDAAGDPEDITAWDFFYTAKEDVSQSDGIAKLSLDPVDFTKSDSGLGTTDTITFTLELAVLPVVPGTYEQDLQTVISGAVSTIGRGQLVVEAQVTDREV